MGSGAIGEMKENSAIIGTRGSRLALAQAQEVIDALKISFPGLKFETKIIRTSGDRSETPAGRIMNGLFVKEIEDELARGGCRIAVHSMKDLTLEQPPGLLVAAVTKRADPFDILISREGHDLRNLPPGSRVGTSSPRRGAMILSERPDLRIVPMRGNVDTRIRKLMEGLCEAIVVAAAACQRLGLGGFAFQRLTPPAFLPAPGQGCLAIEVREDDGPAVEMAHALNHPPSYAAARAERAFLKALGGECSIPAGAYAESVEGDRIRIQGCILSPDGRKAARGDMIGEVTRAEEIGAELAERLKAMRLTNPDSEIP